MRELQEKFIGKGEVKGFDFEAKQKTDKQYVKYPKSTAFGVWAWPIRHFNDAVDKLSQIDNKVRV